MGLAKKITEKGAVSIAKALEAINAGSDLPMAEGLAVELDGITGLAMTNDAREGILAFIEKRRANFTDS
jgi:enoyl-CoA hydratase/carnithine racemase